MKTNALFFWAVVVTTLVLAPVKSANAAPYAVYDLDVTGTDYLTTSTVKNRTRHLVLRDLDPGSTNAITIAWVVPGDEKVYLSHQIAGVGSVNIQSAIKAPDAYTVVSFNISGHETLDNFFGSVIGRAKLKPVKLAPARRAGAVKGVPVSAAAEVLLNAPSTTVIPFAAVLNGNSHSPVDMVFSGENEVLTRLGRHALLMRLNKPLTGVANQTGGAYAPPVKGLPAVAMPTVEEAGSAKLFLLEVLLAQGIAEDDIVDLEPAPLLQWYQDLDGDGFGNLSVSILAAEQPDGYVSVFGDCDDIDDSRYPGAPEVEDGIDNDCDGAVDEDFL